jgi:Aspartyl protease
MNSFGSITLGSGEVSLGFMETPEVGNVPSIRGELNGNPCKILLDSGCGTYAISRAFADEKGIAMIPTPPIPLELAEETDEEREIRSQTKPIRICLGNNVDVWKTFYVLDKGCHDVIFGSPFFHSFTPQFDWGNHEVKIARETHQLLSPTKISAANILSKVISRAKLKALVRRADAESIYVGLLKPTGSSDDSQQPPWIASEFRDVFTEGLPSGLPPSRAVDHEIPLLPNLAPPFRGIFRLSQAELDVLKETLDNLLEEGKINPSTSPYGAPVLFVKKKDGSL